MFPLAGTPFFFFMLNIQAKSTTIYKKALISEVLVIGALISIFFAGAAQAADITASAVIKLTNEARKVANIAELKKSDLLTRAAQDKADDMIAKDYFAHVSPEGKTPWDWMNKNNYNYRFAGENLAINFTTVKEQQKAWMDSELHRKNILNSDYTEIGVAAKQGIIEGNKTMVVVQMFGSPMLAVVSIPTVTKEKIPQAAVAGSQIPAAGSVTGARSIFLTDVETLAAKVDLNKLYTENTGVIIGWSVAFSMALIIFIIDIVAVVHRRHQDFIVIHRNGIHKV